MSERKQRIRATVHDRHALARVLAAALRRSLVSLHIDGAATHGVQILEIITPGLPTVALLAEPTGDRGQNGITFRVVPGNDAHAAQLADFLASLQVAIAADARKSHRTSQAPTERTPPPSEVDEPRSISVKVTFEANETIPPSSGTLTFDDEISAKTESDVAAYAEEPSLQATSLFDPNLARSAGASPAMDDTIPVRDQVGPGGVSSSRVKAAPISAKASTPPSVRPKSIAPAPMPSERASAAPRSAPKIRKRTPSFHDDEPASIPGTTIFDPESLLREAPRGALRPEDSVTDVMLRPRKGRPISSAPPIALAPETEEARAESRLAGRSLGGGKCELRELIGAGASGEVYRASHRDLDRNVAVKVLQAEWRTNVESLRRFHTEARAASRLDHANATRVLDFGDEPDGLLYIVMELLVGRSLDEELNAKQRLPIREAARLMMQICAALGAAHARGIVHRDVKPANVMLVEVEDDDGALHEIVKVCDFGIAKLHRYGEDPTLPSLTRGIAGTPEYMAPELVSGGVADARGDVYACGVMLYELVTGTCPIVGATPMLTLANQVHLAPPPLSTFIADLDPAFEAIVVRAMAKAPEDRFASARVLRRALADFLGIV